MAKSFTDRHTSTLLRSSPFPEWGPEVYAAIDAAEVMRESGEPVTMTGLVASLRKEFGMVMGDSTIRCRVLAHLGREKWT